jgi:hypothetical protein
VSKRFRDTELWDEDWYLSLGRMRSFWDYLCDRCDFAGFWRPNFKRFESLTKVRVRVQEFMETVNTDERERVKVLPNGRWWLTGFVAFQYCQKTRTLNPKNPFHRTIISALDLNEVDYKSVDYGFEVTGGSPIDPTGGVEVVPKGGDKGKGEGKGKGASTASQDPQQKQKQEKPTWKTSFRVYKALEETAYHDLLADDDWIAEWERLNPGLNVRLTIEKAHLEFWGTEAGWRNKKGKLIKAMDWARTYINALALPRNRVWKGRDSEETNYLGGKQ